MAGPKKNTAFTFGVALTSQADTDIFKTSPTLADGDVTVSKDGANFANIGTLPTQIQSTGVLPVALTSTEMNADLVYVLFHDSVGAEWQDLLVCLNTETGTISEIDTNVDTLATNIGTPSDLGGGATVAANLSDIEGQTDDIGTAGAGLTALGDTRLANLDTTVSSRGTADPGDAMTLTAAYDDAKTAAQAGDAMALTVGERTSVAAAIWNALVSGLTTVGSIGKRIVDYLNATISSRATPADVTVSLAVSATEAAAISSGQIALTLWHTLSQIVTSTSTADLAAATKLWLAIKSNPRMDLDAESLVYIELTAGLQYLAGAAYTGTASNGALTVSGEAGDWDILVELDESMTGSLSAWGGEVVAAQVKALVAGDTVNVWSGTCRIGYETVRAIA